MIFAASVALLAGGLYGVYRQFDAPVAAQTAGSRVAVAPPFSLSSLDGRARSLGEFLGTRPVLLEFMDLDCPHCLEMAPILTRLHIAYGARVQFLTVAYERRNDPRRVRAFAERHRHVWPYLMGNMDVARAYRVDGVPSFFLIGTDGRIRGFLEGSAPYEAMSRGLEAVLAER